MVYPRYSREQNLNCKLKKSDILFIRKFYIKGSKEYGQRALAKKFGVTHHVIAYWTDSEKRENFLKQTSDWLKKHKINSRWSKKLRRRKQLIMQKQMGEYNKIRARKFRKNHPGYGSKYYDSKKYRLYYLKKKASKG